MWGAEVPVMLLPVHSWQLTCISLSSSDECCSRENERDRPSQGTGKLPGDPLSSSVEEEREETSGKRADQVREDGGTTTGERLEGGREFAPVSVTCRGRVTRGGGRCEEGPRETAWALSRGWKYSVSPSYAYAMEDQQVHTWEQTRESAGVHINHAEVFMSALFIITPN